MMTGKDLLAALKASGTGEAKLKPGHDYLEANPDCGGGEMLSILTAAATATGTLAKARELLGMTPKEGPQGKPGVVTSESEEILQAMATAGIEPRLMVLARHLFALAEQYKTSVQPSLGPRTLPDVPKMPPALETTQKRK